MGMSPVTSATPAKTRGRSYWTDEKTMTKLPLNLVIWSMACRAAVNPAWYESLSWAYDAPNSMYFPIYTTGY
jgi:hypothetical protein